MHIRCSKAGPPYISPRVCQDGLAWDTPLDGEYRQQRRERRHRCRGTRAGAHLTNLHKGDHACWADAPRSCSPPATIAGRGSPGPRRSQRASGGVDLETSFAAAHGLGARPHCNPKRPVQHTAARRPPRSTSHPPEMIRPAPETRRAGGRWGVPMVPQANASGVPTIPARRWQSPLS